MNVVLKMVWTLKVDDQADSFDIKPSCTDTCSDHDGFDSFFEIVNCKLPIVMVHSAMQSQCMIAIFQKLLEQVIDFCLLVDKNENASLFIPLTQDL